MSEQKQCPECEALIDGALERCPVCDETLAAPITFERYSGVLNRNDGFRLRWQRNNTPENQHLIGPWNGDATDGDLRAAGYVRLPSAEELAKRIHAMANPNCFPPAIWPEGGCGGCWAEAERALRALEVTA